MNYSSVVEQAVTESKGELTSIIAKKLAELVGSEIKVTIDLNVKVANGAAATKSAANGVVKTRAQRTPSAKLADMRAQVLKVFTQGVSLQKAQVLTTASIDKSDALRVAGILKKLKEEGVLQMTGDRGAATYALKSA